MYNFEGIEKTLAKKTFAREEKAKEVAGITQALGNELSSLVTKFQAVYESYEKETDADNKAKLMTALLEINEQKSKLEEKMNWFNDFDKVIAVLDILLVEGSGGLTKENICGQDAEEVWKDFFTQRNNIKSTPLAVK